MPEKPSSSHVLQSRAMLIRFHIILVAAGIFFCLGFALYLFFQNGPARTGADVGLGALFALFGAGLGLYLRQVLRHGVRP